MHICNGSVFLSCLLALKGYNNVFCYTMNNIRQVSIFFIENLLAFSSHFLATILLKYKTNHVTTMSRKEKKRQFK